jgi:hypothetical protein
MRLSPILTAIACGSVIGTNAASATAIDLMWHQNTWTDEYIVGQNETTRQFNHTRLADLVVKTQIWSPILMACLELAMMYLDTHQSKEMTTNLPKWLRKRFMIYSAVGLAVGLLYVTVVPQRRILASLYIVLSTTLLFGYFLSTTNLYLWQQRQQQKV